MFGRRILAAVALVAASAQAQLTITNPSPSSWWVAASVNTLAWTCNTSPDSAFTVVLSSSDKTILNAPLALIPNVPNFDCSYSVNQQLSSQPPSPSYTLSLVDIQNITNIYASTNFEIKAVGSTYPSASSAASGSGTATGTATGAASSGSSTPGSKSSGAVANYIPVGVCMAAALVMGLVVA